MKKVLIVIEAPKKMEMFINTLPPLGALYMASYLETHGVPCDVLDRNAERERGIDPSAYECIAFSVNLSNISNSLERIEEVKKHNPGVKVIVGGPSCMSNPDFFLSRETIDAVCVGEGERALLEYATRDDGGAEPIANLWIKGRKSGEIVKGPLEWIDDLDGLPFPALNKVDLHKYRVPIRKAFPISGIVTSRGCPYDCIFCFHSMGKKWRYRSAVNVADEIEWQARTLGVKEICVHDDNFTMNVQRAHEICDLVEERGIEIKFQFINGIRMDRVDAALMEKFARIGVWYSVISPETGSERVLQRIKKKMTLAQVEEAARQFKEAGIILYGAYMIGFPFEERQDIEKTIEFAKKLDTTFAQFSIVTPLPKTELFDIAGFDEREFDMEKGLFFGDVKCHVKGVTDDELKELVKKAYRTFYLRPRKIWELLRTLPLRSLFELFLYSLRTENL